MVVPAEDVWLSVKVISFIALLITASVSLVKTQDYVLDAGSELGVVYGYEGGDTGGSFILPCKFCLFACCQVIFFTA